MVRLVDGIITNPLLVIGGWIGAVVIITILIRINPRFENDELSQYATLGAYVFVLNSIIIPIQIFFPFIPFPLTLSGVALVIIISGVKKGLLISSAALILNHIFIPGAASMLGLNLTNMTIAAVIVGYIPSLIYRRMGRRVRYMSGFFAGLIFVIIEGILIIFEFAISHPETSRKDLFLILELLILFFVLLGLIEGFFTAIASSYYYQAKEALAYINQKYRNEEEEEEEEIEKIKFLDDVEVN